MSTPMIVGIVIFLILLLILFVLMIIPTSSEKMTSGNKDIRAPGYVFYPGMDSDGYNIGNQSSLMNNVSSLASYCDSIKNCRGFNTNGWIKSDIIPQNKLYCR